MKSQSTHYTGRRSHRGRRRRSSRGATTTTPVAPPPKPSFWQRIVAFFKGPAEESPKVGEKPVPAATTTTTTTTTREKISRKPELVEVTSPKLYVGNLSFDASESDLFELFNGVGQVKNAEVVCHKYTQRSKGFAFVQMTTIEEARRAVQELHDKEFLGRKLVVSGAKTPDMERAA
jgi:RNA recognition motif. (a.k.a. RRM, RBD, or RNP domain)